MALNPFSRMRNPAYRRYAARITVATVIYVGAVFTAASVLHKHAPATPGAILLALLPGLAVLGMIWAIVRLLLELNDEYLRMLEVRKAMIATALTLSVCSVWGLLEIFTDVQRLPLFWVFPGWAFGLGIGAMVNRLTLGDGGCA